MTSPSHTVFIQMRVMGDDIAVSRHPVFCFVRRKLGRFFAACGVSVHSVVE
jgi:hypothetical protein